VSVGELGTKNERSEQGGLYSDVVPQSRVKFLQRAQVSSCTNNKKLSYVRTKSDPVID
jgi:hypothetical protein